MNQSIKMKFKLLALLTLLGHSLLAQLTITITSTPSNTPSSDNIHIAGNFQNWNPGDPNYQLDNLGNGQHQITINPAAGTLEFKFTRGSWDSVEGNANGGFIPNRTYTYNGSASNLDLGIAGWEDLGGTGSSTAADNVHLLDNNFFMPELNRSRRIWIYLPPDYETTNKHYPVFYMHDGQNLFDVQTSFSGEWEVDESLNELFSQGDHGAIVVGIDNGGALRLDEYSPWYNNNYNAGGEGEQYINFIAETLKPYIDDNYRTLTEPVHTVLFGSSLGGLISQYGLMQRQDVFGKAGVFSPAFWFNPEVYNHSETTPKQGAKKIYMLAGIPEDNGSVVDAVNQMEAALLNNDFTNEEVNKAFHTDGQHSEWYWAREFRWAYLWLFDGEVLSAISEQEAKRIRLYPNPADTTIYLANLPVLKRPVAKIIGMDGQVVHSEKLDNDDVDVSSLAPGVYVLEITAKKNFRFSRKIVIR
jgi:predicted alpha/beta superfamily hydrolase